MKMIQKYFDKFGVIGGGALIGVPFGAAAGWGMAPVFSGVALGALAGAAAGAVALPMVLMGLVLASPLVEDFVRKVRNLRGAGKVQPSGDLPAPVPEKKAELPAGPAAAFAKAMDPEPPGSPEDGADIKLKI